MSQVSIKGDSDQTVTAHAQRAGLGQEERKSEGPLEEVSWKSRPAA